MDKDATEEQGVSEETEADEKLLPADDERMQLMDQLVEQNEQADQEYSDQEEAVIDEQESDEDAQAEPPVETDEQELETEAEDEETRRLKIDGEEQDVPLSKVIEYGERALQKEIAADKRLEQASRETAEARKLLEEVKQQRALSQDTPAKKTETTERNADPAALAEAIRMGTDEEAVEAIRQFQKNTAVSPEQIQSMVDNRITQQSLYEKLTSSPEQGGFNDLTEDEEYGGPIFRQQIDKQMNSGAPYNLETYQKAAESARKIINKRSKATDMEVKKEKKRAASQQDAPKGANLRAVPPPEEEIQTKQQILEEMQKARGQL